MPAVILVGKQGRVVKGGGGSGNFGHHGRPGQRGGSAPNGGPQAPPSGQRGFTLADFETDDGSGGAPTHDELVAWLQGDETPERLKPRRDNPPPPKPKPTPKPTLKPQPKPAAAPAAQPQGKPFRYLNKSDPWVAELEAKRTAFLAEVNALPDRDKLQEIYQNSVASAWNYRNTPDAADLTRYSEQCKANWEQAEAKERAIFLKHFGNAKKQKWPMPQNNATRQAYFKDTTMQAEMDKATDFIQRTVERWPEKPRRGNGPAKKAPPPLPLTAGYVPDLQRAYYAGDWAEPTIMLNPKDPASTIVHETGHFLDQKGWTNGQQNSRYLLGFRDARAPKSTPASALRLFGGGYDAEEMTRADDFVHAYVGRESAGSASEVLSMGLQYLYENSRQLATVDPEHFVLTLGILKGTAQLPTRATGKSWIKGGEGSGNFGHAGRPGQVGGSAGTDLAAVAAAITEKRQMPTQVLENTLVGQSPRFAAKGKWAVMDSQGSFIGPFEATPERALAAHRKLTEEAEQRARADVVYGEAADRVLAGTPTPADLRTIAGGGTKITRTGIERLLKRSGWTDKQIRGFVSRLGIYGETGGGATLYSPAEVAERLAKTPKPTGKSWTGRIMATRVAKGGPGSGFHGHAGRPGERGGSQARRNPLEEAVARMKEAGVQRTVDTSQVDNMDLGRAAYIEDGKLITFHVTDDPDALQQRLAEGVALRGGTPHSELGSGLYGSTVPDYWMGRSTDKYSFLNKLDKSERTRLADLLQQQLDRAKGQFITPSEYERGVRNLHAFVEQNSNYGAVSLAEQPYNFRFWKPEWLTEHGFTPGKQPAIMRIEARGVFAEVDRSLGETGSQKLIDLGFDGAYMVGGWSTDPQVVIWNPKAIVGYSEEETTVKAFFLAALGFTKGGDGSGNFDHAGRPGERGGSAPSSAPSATTDWWASRKTIFDVMFGRKDIALDEEIGTAILPDGMEAKVRADAVAALAKATKLPAAEIDDLFTQWEEGANTQSGLGTLGIQAVASETFKAPLSAWQKRRYEENRDRARADFGKRFAQALLEGETPDAALKTATDGIDDHDLYPFQLAALNKLKAPSNPTAAQALAYYAKSVAQANAQTEKLLKAMYAQTQQAFKDAGLRSLRVYRGVTLPGQKWQAGDAVKPDLNAISSWTVLGQTAQKDFAAEPGGYVLERSILPEHILAIPTTGFGKLAEGEILILGTAGNQGVFVRSKTGKAFTTVKGGEGSGYFHHAGLPGHRGGSAPDGVDTLTGGPAESAAPPSAPVAHGLTLPTINLRNRPAVHKQLDAFLSSSPALSKAASSRLPLPRTALAPIPEKHLGEVMRATGVDSKLPTKQNLAIGAKSLYLPVQGQDELDAYMAQRLAEKGPRSAAGSGGKGSFFKPSPAKGANAHAQLKKDAQVADGKKLEKTRKTVREETRGLLLSAVEEAARTGNWQSANALQIKYELTGGVETFALLMGYQAVDLGTQTGILVLDRSSLAVNPTPIVGVTPPEPPQGNSPTPLPHQVPGLGRGRIQTPLLNRGTIVKGGTGSGNFSHHGRPGQRGGSAPNGGPQREADHADLVAQMVGKFDNPAAPRLTKRQKNYLRMRDQGFNVALLFPDINPDDFPATPSVPPAAPAEGGTLWNPQAAAVQQLEKKRKAFLKELDQAGLSLTDLRARYDELARRSAFMNRKDPLTEAEKKEWYAMIDNKVIEKKVAADRALLLKYFGNAEPTPLPMPDVKLNYVPFQENYQAQQTFLSRLLNQVPWEGDGRILRPQVTVQPGIRSYFSEMEDHIYITDEVGNAAIHEYGHWLEKNGSTSAGISYATLANGYLNGRTQGSKAVPLSSLVQDGGGYNKSEYARPDHFISPYTGKQYNRGATEITSTGLGYLFSDPGDFAREDPDHFLFTLHLLQGG